MGRPGICPARVGGAGAAEWRGSRELEAALEPGGARGHRGAALADAAGADGSVLGLARGGRAVALADRGKPAGRKLGLAKSGQYVYGGRQYGAAKEAFRTGRAQRPEGFCGAE